MIYVLILISAGGVIAGINQCLSDNGKIGRPLIITTSLMLVVSAIAACGLLNGLILVFMFATTTFYVLSKTKKTFWMRPATSICGVVGTVLAVGNLLAQATRDTYEYVAPSLSEKYASFAECGRVVGDFLKPNLKSNILILANSATDPEMLNHFKSGLDAGLDSALFSSVVEKINLFIDDTGGELRISKYDNSTGINKIKSAIRSNSNALTVVSLIKIPNELFAYYWEQHTEEPASPRRRFILVNSMPNHAEIMVNAGLIAGIVAGNPTPGIWDPSVDSEPVKSRLFDRHFLFITRKNIAAIKKHYPNLLTTTNS